jgi:phosphorylcholine metabolism protein LicD
VQQFHSHYDGRFASEELLYEDRKSHLSHLVRTYLSTMSDIGAQTWIMHGTLLGWWWNRRILPWDSDIDVQVSEPSMRYLADYYNMTVHHYKLPGVLGGRDYMLEINPHYVNDSIHDKLNVIDARWIDMDTGLFIDITTLRRDRQAESQGVLGRMMCKDKHHYLEKDIFPLRETTFENVTVMVPFAYTELLEEEYGPRSLTNKNFEHHHFDEKVMEWIPIR